LQVVGYGGILCLSDSDGKGFLVVLKIKCVYCGQKILAGEDKMGTKAHCPKNIFDNYRVDAFIDCTLWLNTNNNEGNRRHASPLTNNVV